MPRRTDAETILRARPSSWRWSFARRPRVSHRRCNAFRRDRLPGNRFVTTSTLVALAGRAQRALDLSALPLVACTKDVRPARLGRGETSRSGYAPTRFNLRPGARPSRLIGGHGQGI